MSDTAFLTTILPRIVFACRSRGMIDAESDVSLTENQMRTLSYLDPDDPTMVTELADFIGVTPSTMSLNLKRLEAGGYVSRLRDPHDRRARNVRLTADGKRVVDAHRAFDPERVARVLEHLRPEDRQRAVEGIAILAEAADASIATGRAHVAALTGESGE